MKTYSRKNSSYLKKAFVASNFNEMCRLCLSEVDLLLTPIIQDYKTSYKEKIQYSVDVTIEEGDGLPPNICEECLIMIEQIFLFKKKCQAADSKLREHLELLELNEECKINSIRLNDVSEDQDLFEKKSSDSIKKNESNTVYSGGTSDDDFNKKNDNENNHSVEAISSVKEHPKSPAEVNLNKNNESLDFKMVDEDIKEEFQEKIVIKEVKRYILKGEKREGDQEEDLTVCEVIPLETKSIETVDSDSENPESPKYTVLESKNQNGHLNVDESSGSLPFSEKTGTRIQEIYKLWDNEEDSEEVCESQKSDDQVMILDVTLEDNEHKNIRKPNVQILELELDQNGIPQTHRVYTNKNHIEIVETKPQTRCFKCFVCTEQFSTYSALKEHLAKIHKDVSDAPYCEICGKKFTCTNSLKRHMAVHTGFKPYKCKICERKFSQGSILKRHILTHESLKPFNCHICQKSYTQKMNLLSHLKNHGFQTGAESFKCKTCGKTFVHQSGLSRHTKLHKGVRFLCIHCEKSFGDASALARHVKALHQQQSNK